MRIILIGHGKTVYYLARDFHDSGFHVTIIASESEVAKTLSRRLDAVVTVGDGSDPQILEEAGVRRADAVLSLLPNDEDNLVACQAAQRSFKVPTIVALINDPDNERVFRELGIDSVISPTRLLITMIKERARFRDLIELLPVAGGRVNVTEVVLKSDAASVGRTLMDLNMPPATLIAAVIRRDDVVIPRGESVLEADDRLLVVSTEANLDAALSVLLS